MERPPRILLVRLSAHGDIVQTLPLLGWLRQACPQARIDWLVGEAGAALLEGHPQLDKLLVVPQRNRQRGMARHAEQLGQLLDTLRQARYDLALDTQGLLKSAIWPVWANIPVRVGFTPAREGARWLYTHRVPEPDRRSGQEHASLVFTRLLQPLGVPLPASRLALLAQLRAAPLTKAAWQEATDRLAFCPSRQPIVVLAPFTRWASKNWPLAHWKTLLESLTELAVTVVFVGSANDRSAIEALIQQVGRVPQPTLNLAGQTSLPGLQAVLQQAAVLVGGDSLALHLGGLVASQQASTATERLQLIGLFGPTASGRTGPLVTQGVTLLQQTALPCLPCHQKQCRLAQHDCLLTISPQQVLQAVQQALALRWARNDAAQPLASPSQHEATAS